MSLRKNHLKKLSQQELINLLNHQTNTDNIKIIHSFISQKNQTLLDKRNILKIQIEKVRNGIQKNINHLNNRVRERLEKKEMIILDRNSRPNEEKISDLMQLFTYHQQQAEVINRNHEDINQLTGSTLSKINKLKQISQQRVNCSQLDNKYDQLNQECEEEESIKQNLIKDRDQRRINYGTMRNSIEQCRKEYQIVEDSIRNKERQLIQLTTYFNTRTEEDNSILIDLPLQAISLQRQLMNVQNKFSHQEAVLQDRLMKLIDSYERGMK